jgi:hypothetical protein
MSFSPVELVDGISWSINSPPGSSFYVKSHDTTYDLNLSGHRGPEFSSGIDTLFLGCSVTYGTGLELEELWPYLLSEKLNYSYNLLASPGASIPKIVRQAIEWINLYGKPKQILALMPDTTRIDFCQPIQGQHKNLMVANEMKLYNKLKKETLIYEDVSTKKFVAEHEYSNIMAFSALNTLEKICSILDIPLMWSSWSKNSDLPNFNNYFELSHWPNELEKEKCTDHTPIGRNFYIASDNDHWGSHYHMHVAEDFLNAIELSNAI